jgi:two-component system alkaline phosphatase synthesis response regulator PhoP
MRKKILVVEDDAELLELLRLSFKNAGFSIATANNGIEALKKARSITPDAILLDLVLPELDGFAVCETLRRDPVTAEIPIVVVTGLSSELSRLAVLESGADDYVSKPISPRELVSKIRHVFGAQRRSAPRAKAKPSQAAICME